RSAISPSELPPAPIVRHGSAIAIERRIPAALNSSRSAADVEVPTRVESQSGGGQVRPVDVAIRPTQRATLRGSSIAADAEGRAGLDGVEHLQDSERHAAIF